MTYFESHLHIFVLGQHYLNIITKRIGSIKTERRAAKTVNPANTGTKQKNGRKFKSN